ncbi:MAG TPA: alpha/beta hydrolase [Bacilli bacterium]|nr:alpha/beta hydrolase [Bacilli bacterium]
MTSVPSMQEKTIPILLLQGRFEEEDLPSNLRTTLNAAGHHVATLAVEERHRRSLFITERSVEEAAQDALRTLDELGWEQALVVAHSWDCLIARRLGAVAAERFSGLVLLDPLPLADLPWGESISFGDKTSFPKLIVMTASEEGSTWRHLRDLERTPASVAHHATEPQLHELFLLECADPDLSNAQCQEIISAFSELRCRN